MGTAPCGPCALVKPWESRAAARPAWRSDLCRAIAAFPLPSLPHDLNEDNEDNEDCRRDVVDDPMQVRLVAATPKGVEDGAYGSTRDDGEADAND